MPFFVKKSLLMEKYLTLKNCCFFLKKNYDDNF